LPHPVTAAKHSMEKSLKTRARNETLLFLYLFLVGIVALPVLVYAVGSALFGDYGGTGFSAFYGSLHRGLRSGQLAAWFLVLSPYLLWQIVRGTLHLQSGIGRTR
jgi:hypothetical protein